MAHLHRLIGSAVALLACLLLAAYPHPALAVVPTVTGYTCVVQAGNGVRAYATDCQSAAQTLAHFYGQGVPVNCQVTWPSQDGCTINGYGLGVEWQTQQVCPSNSTMDAGGASCSCSSGFDEANGQCVPQKNDCEKLAGQSAGPKNYEGRGDEFFFCDGWNSAGGGKCVVKVVPSFRWEDRDTGRWISQGTGIYTGAQAKNCNGSGGSNDGAAGGTPKPEDGKAPDKPDPGTAAPAPCPLGQAPGEVNGQRVCAPRGADGKVEEKSSGSSKNGNGDTVKTDKETKCEGGQCTTTETKCTTPNGQTTSTCSSTSTSGSSSSLCSPGSNLKICGDGDTTTSFSGNCAAGFKAVSEDAVINAMAEETYRQNCKVNPDEASQALAKANVGKEGSQTGTLPGNASVSIGPGSFDTSDALGGGAACMPDLTVSLLGRPQTLPFSVLCDYLGYMGGVLLAVSFLLAARIVTRG